MTHSRRIVLFGLVVFSAFSARAGQNAPGSSSLNPSDGDTVVFLGDSITWQDYYPEYIEAYFIRRHPEKKIRFVSLGVRGDTAAGAVERLARDLYPLSPDLVFVMLGMNDGGYRGYNPLLYRFYLAGMEEIVNLVAKNTKAKTVLLSSTCVDPVDHNRKHYNRMLSKMADGLRGLARRLRVPFVDVLGPFSRALKMARELCLPVSLMQDAVHPAEAGHVVIASVLLDRLDPTETRRQMLISLDMSALSWNGNRACLGFSHPNDNIYIPPKALAALNLVHDSKRFSSRKIVIVGLKSRVRVYIDNKDVGVFSPEDFVHGVPMDRIDKAPWVSDARLLYDLLREKWRLTYYLWDPQKLAIDAWRQVNPGRAVLTKKDAYDRLIDISGRIESLRVSKERLYSFCVEKLLK